MKQEEEKPPTSRTAVPDIFRAICWTVIGFTACYALLIVYPAIQLKLPKRCVVLYNYAMSLKAEIKDLGEKNQECVRVLRDTIEVCDEEAP